LKALAAALLFASVATTAAALPGLPEGKWWKRPRIAAAIELTSEQKDRIESIFTRARPTLIDLKADLEKKQGELQDALDDANVDRGAVAARVEALEDARAELQKARILMVLDMKQVLKPEQWDRLVRMNRQQRRERFGKSHERRQPPDQRPRR
jgi:Spy/CpxP family protein refolding chaperone